MLKLQNVVVRAQNAYTGQLMPGMKRKAYIEYDADELPVAVVTAGYALTSPSDASGTGKINVFRKEIETVFDDGEETTVTVSSLVSKVEQFQMDAREFNEKYPGLPVTM